MLWPDLTPEPCQSASRPVTQSKDCQLYPICAPPMTPWRVNGSECANANGPKVVVAPKPVIRFAIRLAPSIADIAADIETRPAQDWRRRPAATANPLAAKLNPAAATISVNGLGMLPPESERMSPRLGVQFSAQAKSDAFHRYPDHVALSPRRFKEKRRLRIKL